MNGQCVGGGTGLPHPTHWCLYLPLKVIILPRDGLHSPLHANTYMNEYDQSNTLGKDQQLPACKLFVKFMRNSKNGLTNNEIDGYNNSYSFDTECFLRDIWFVSQMRGLLFVGYSDKLRKIMARKFVWVRFYTLIEILKGWCKICIT